MDLVIEERWLQAENADANGMFTNDATVERIGARTERAVLSNGDTVGKTIAVLDQGADFAFRVAGNGDGDGETASRRRSMARVVDRGSIPQD